MDELQMVRELLPPPPPPSPEVTAAVRARALGQIHPPRRRWVPWSLGLPLAAGAAAVALLAAGLGGAPGRPTGAQRSTAPGSVTPVSTAPGGATTVLSARDILLAAATSAAKNTPALSTGRYWRVRTAGMELRPSGPAGHPYNMAFSSSTDNWNARDAGVQSVWMSQDNGARPATQADAAAWRAAGAPNRWASAVFWDSQTRRPAYRYLTLAAQPVFTDTQNLNGDVGDAVGDGSWLTAKQFAAFPADPAKLKALMIHYAYWDYRAVGVSSMPPMNQILMGEAVNLLQDPLTPPAESAVYKVMAGLPGSRSLGVMRDPLGRSGYGIAIADPSQLGVPWITEAASQAVVIVDPASGRLLATEMVVKTPGRTVVSTAPHRGKTAAPRCKAAKSAPSMVCDWPLYYGPQYQGQVWAYSAIVSAAWTNASPPR